jgi:hypothetical protein
MMSEKHSTELGVGRGTGVAMIAAERVRQVQDKGWTAEYDSGHDDGSLAHAALMILCDNAGLVLVAPETLEPWTHELADHVFNKYGQVDRLVRAGALIAAEIDRLRRQVSA